MLCRELPYLVVVHQHRDAVLPFAYLLVHVLKREHRRNAPPEYFVDGGSVCGEDASVEAVVEKLANFRVGERGARADDPKIPARAGVRVSQDACDTQPSVRTVGRNRHQNLALSRLHDGILSKRVCLCNRHPKRIVQKVVNVLFETPCRIL